MPRVRKIRATPIVFLLSVIAVAAAGCESEPVAVPESLPTVIEAQSAQYSPFWVHTSGPELPFNAITFKDVGMSLPVEDRAFIYESLAETLAHDLRGQAIESHVSHSAALTDPSNHMSCESEHVYVDVWQSGPGYGYSLWSGCGEDDLFAHEEFEGVPSRRSEHLATLSSRIVRDLQHAVATGCFTRAC